MIYRVYLRVSTDEQAQSGLGLEAQRDAIERWLDVECKLEHVQCEWYADEGLSGSLPPSRRPGLEALLSDLQRGDVLVVHTLKRLSRDMLDSLLIEREVKDKGARLVSVQGEGTDDSDDESAFVLRTLSRMIADLERRQVSRRTRAALAAKARRGEVTGQIPYGCARDGDRLVPRADEIEVLGLMVRMRMERHTLQAIADELNARGLRNRWGKTWKAGRVSALLRRMGVGKG